MEGRKDDADKLRFELLVPNFIAEMAKVLTLGAKKYSDNSWQNVPNAKQRYIGAMLRHANELQQNHEMDFEWPDSEVTYHAAQVAVNAMFIHWLNQNHTDEVKI